MRYVSIAKDFYYETSASTLSYYITCNGRTIYSGVSVKPSDSPVNRINIRQRVADYLEIDMPDFRDYDGVVIPHPEQLRDFELYSSDGTLLETYRALLGYYDEWDGNVDEVLSDPVNGHTDPRQKIFWGSFNTTEREIEVSDDAPYSEYLTIEAISAGTITWEAFSGGYVDFPYIDYSLNGGVTWITIQAAFEEIPPENIIHLNAGEKVIFKQSYGSLENGHLLCEGKFNVYGDLSSVYPTCTARTDSRFLSFIDSDIINAKHLVLPSVDISSIPYPYNTFDPEYLYTSYNSMFSGCTSLTTAPKIPLIIGREGCVRMFEGCTSLVNAPSITTQYIGYGCFFRMFKDCTSLKNPPKILPAEELVYDRFYFWGCYQEMFSGCTSLEKSPILPAEQLKSGCYRRMFYGCSSLSEITCLATDLSANNCLDHWTYGVAPTGTFYKKAGVEWPRGYSGIPYNWTVVDVD